MPRIKGWRKGKDTGMIIYWLSTTKKCYKHISLAERRLLGRKETDYVVFIAPSYNKCSPDYAIQRVFKTKEKARKFVISFMKRHSSG